MARYNDNVYICTFVNLPQVEQVVASPTAGLYGIPFKWGDSGGTTMCNHLG